MSTVASSRFVCSLRTSTYTLLNPRCWILNAWVRIQGHNRSRALLLVAIHSMRQYSPGDQTTSTDCLVDTYIYIYIYTCVYIATLCSAIRFGASTFGRLVGSYVRSKYIIAMRLKSIYGCGPAPPHVSDNVYKTFCWTKLCPENATHWIICRTIRSVGATGGVHKGQGRNRCDLIMHTY